MSLFKKKEKIPDFPFLHFYYLNIEKDSWDILSEMPIHEYIDNSNGKSFHQEDIETLEKWRKDNPDWDIDIVNQRIWRKV